MNKFGKRGVMNLNTGDSSHSGLYGLGIVYVYRVLRADNMFDTKPVRQPDNRTQVPRVLNIIQCQAKRLACEIRT